MQTRRERTIWGKLSMFGKLCLGSLCSAIGIDGVLYLCGCGVIPLLPLLPPPPPSSTWLSEVALMVQWEVGG